VARVRVRRTAVRRLTLVAATIATGLAAGFFYAYHVSVTRGHALIGDRAYVEAMQAINATVRNVEFALGFPAVRLTPPGTTAKTRPERRSERPPGLARRGKDPRHALAS